MITLPIIQSFFDKPVRFFKANFELELRGRNDPSDIRKITLETWAIPFPDFCRAVDYDERATMRLIQRSPEVFQPFHRYEDILDMNGVQKRRTILMAQEMCDMLTAKLHTSRIKDPAKRSMVIDFQKNLMYMFHLIRTGKLRGAYIFKSGVPAEYQRILSLPSGRATSAAVRELAATEGIGYQQIYGRLQRIRGSNTITAKGIPKKRRCTAGAYKNTDEFKAVEMCKCQLPTMTNKQIAEATGVSYGKVNLWLRAA